MPPVLITQSGSERFLSLHAPLAARVGAVDLVLRRPMQQVMASYFKIRNVLLTIAALALACAIALALRIGPAPRGQWKSWLRRRSASKPDNTTNR